MVWYHAPAYYYLTVIFISIGLQLELYTGSRLRQEKYALTRGFRILALNKTFTQQKIEDFGVDVSVGQATNIVVRRTVINRIKSSFKVE